MGGRCSLYLFTCNSPARFASRPSHVELIDSSFTHSRLLFFSLLPFPAPFFTQLLVAMLSSLSRSLSFFFIIAFIYLFFKFTCFSCWMSTSPWLPISGCANFSLQPSLISQLLLSLHCSPAFCMSFCGSFTFSLPCYAALATVTTSQDLI